MVDNKDLRERFRQLVNAPADEDAPIFIRERGQKRPPDWDQADTSKEQIPAEVAV